MLVCLSAVLCELCESSVENVACMPLADVHHRGTERTEDSQRLLSATPDTARNRLLSIHPAESLRDFEAWFLEPHPSRYNKKQQDSQKFCHFPPTRVSPCSVAQ